MFRFILNNWRRNKQRFVLMLIGALIISSGLSYFVGLQENNRGLIEELLQERWKASYDIVVRPQGTRSLTEEQGLLEPNYQSGIAGGITREQFDIIKNIDGVEIAAPIAVLGYTSSSVSFKEGLRKDLEPGVYRYHSRTINSNGISEEERESDIIHFAHGNWNKYDPIKGNNEAYGVVNWRGSLHASTTQLIVGIDPIEEARLVGLDQAVSTHGFGRYFDEEEYMPSHELTLFPDEIKKKVTTIPVLVSSQPFHLARYEYIIEKLDLPFDTYEIANETMEKVKENGGESYLGQLKAIEQQVYEYDSIFAHHIYVSALSGFDPITKERVYSDEYNVNFSWLIQSKVSPLIYQPTESPFPERWMYAFEIQPFEKEELNSEGEISKSSTYREFLQYADDWRFMPQMLAQYIGFYDPERLNISLDPLSELPMETYRPASARLVLNKDGEPINPPKTVTTDGKPNGLLTSPPVLLTTIDASEIVMEREDVISVIRIKVEGVDRVSDESQAKLEAIAKEIEEKTGLITDITLGSSPQPILAYVPGVDGQESLGWIEQPWIKLGASYTIYTESRMGFSSLILIVMLVAIVYVLSTSVVSYLARKKELAILLAIGWRSSQLVKMVFVEAIIMGCIVATMAWIMVAIVYFQGNGMITLTTFLGIGLVGFLIYLLGAVIPSIIVGQITPYEGLRTGEVSKNSIRISNIKGRFSMALGHFVGKWKRNILSILSIMLPTALLMFFIFITFRLQGIFYTTWLGQYITMEVGPAHYIAIIVTLCIAVLTTNEIIWQNVAERKAEISILKAIGWRNGSIRLLIIFEGFIVGLIAGLIGYGLGILFINMIYHQLPYNDLWLLAVMLIPILVGMLGSVIPAQMAARLSPILGMHGLVTLTQK